MLSYSLETSLLVDTKNPKKNHRLGSNMNFGAMQEEIIR